MKIEDVPNNTFFGYDVERARYRYGYNCSYSDIYFKIGEYDNKNYRIIHFTFRYGATETTMGKQTIVYENKNELASRMVIEWLFSDKYRYIVHRGV